MTDDRIARFKRWFWRPPRAHGDLIHDRTVGFLELYYDLVYVAVIIQLAHRLAHELTWVGLFQFTVVFVLVFIAWVNGSLYLELHGHEDGRTRTIVFIQITLLALIAVFIGDAESSTGQEFALVYGAFLALMTWLWHDARGEDRGDHPDSVRPLGAYVAILAISAAVILATAFLPAPLRVLVWAAFGVVWLGEIWLAGRVPPGLQRVIVPTEALVERFGLFVIIVLGEVFFGVVSGLVAIPRDARTIGTAMAALLLGFAFGWIYFDLVGRRLPKHEGPALARWMLGHLPMTLAITLTGAAGVSLIEHAHDAATPAGTALALSGSVAIALLALVAIKDTLQDAARLPAVYGPVGIASVGGAVAALAVGWLRPAPWLLAVALVAILAILWLFTIARFMITDDPDQPDRGGAVRSGSD
jgi:low temperature requirement protein LtrA